jgi:Uma2 family endonuclease
MVTTVLGTGIPETWWSDFVPPEGLKAEIVQGELVLTPSPNADHGFAQSALFRSFDVNLPPGFEIVQGLEWRLAFGGVVAAAPEPDLMVVRREPDLKVSTKPPLLAVEVLSQSDSELLPTGLRRIEGKRLDYAANGLEHYLEVESPGDPKKRHVRRYELRKSELVVVAEARGTDQLLSDVPYPYEIDLSKL